MILECKKRPTHAPRRIDTRNLSGMSTKRIRSHKTIIISILSTMRHSIRIRNTLVGVEFVNDVNTVSPAMTTAGKTLRLAVKTQSESSHASKHAHRILHGIAECDTCRTHRNGALYASMG